MKRTKKQLALDYVDSYYIPENIDLIALAAETGKSYEGCLFVISYIKHHYMFVNNPNAYANDENLNELNYFVNIGRDTLVKRLGGKYLSALKTLESLRIIRINPKYQAGSFSKSYKLTKDYAFSQTVKLSFNKRLTGQRLEIFLREQKRFIRSLNPVQKAIWDNLTQLTIDAAAVRIALSSPAVTSKEKKRRNRLRVASERIADKDLYLHEGVNQRRIYHILTQSPRELRDCVRLNGKTLTTLDVRSCQPVLLLALMDGISETEISDYKAALDIDIYSSLSSNTFRDDAKKDFLRFAFYEYVGKTDERKTTRLAMSEFARTFCARFPEITAWITKQVGLACRLQDLEAEICVYEVGAQLARAQTFFITIHDGFLMKDEDADAAIPLLEQAIRARTNYTPTITSKTPKAAPVSVNCLFDDEQQKQAA